MSSVLQTRTTFIVCKRGAPAPFPSPSTTALRSALTCRRHRASTVLGENGYLKDPEFLEYLHYLQYWADPKYARFIQ